MEQAQRELCLSMDPKVKRVEDVGDVREWFRDLLKASGYPSGRRWSKGN